MSKINETLQAIDEQVAILRSEVQQFEGGKKVAATRARGAAMGIIKDCKEIRTLIQEARS